MPHVKFVVQNRSGLFKRPTGLRVEITNALVNCHTCTPPSVVWMSSSKSLPNGSAAAVFTATIWGTPPLDIQWYHNGQPIAGANQSCLQWTQLTVADLGTYQVSLSSTAWTWYLDPVEIQFNSEGLNTVAARNKLFDSNNAALIGHN